MRSLHAFFLRSDTDNSGQISVPEFIDLIGATDSAVDSSLITPSDSFWICVSTLSRRAASIDLYSEMSSRKDLGVV